MWGTLRELCAHALHAGLLALVVWLVVQLLLFLLAHGHVTRIRTVLRARRKLALLPAGAVFHCRDGRVVMTVYDPRTDEERSAPVLHFSHPTLLRWRGGAARSRPALRGRLTAEAAWRTGLLLVVTVPLFVVVGWLTVRRDPLWAYALACLVAHQIMLTALGGRLFLVKFWAVTALTGYLFLDRAQLWHPSPGVAAALYSGSWMFSMIGIAVLARREGISASTPVQRPARARPPRPETEGGGRVK
ncbi:hypothetical protein [Streptomyces antimicrobicus]|uniref:Uncharacterized protein n=1 Tax=Streptomyces antimicrobicus TaxID=2883108 RepID=A0ABS8B7G0_9ACTN|nr:hypothetical protein [Streptomyces antimicrobicus]MCB5180554.1 hypothetical protein [Streptomyces antimicrobicus]